MWPRFWINDVLDRPTLGAEYEFVGLHIMSTLTLIGFYPYYDRQRWSDNKAPEILMGYSGDELGITEEFKFDLIPKWLRAKHKRAMDQAEIDEVDYRMWINCM
jgi:hypothetical protein